MNLDSSKLVGSARVAIAAISWGSWSLFLRPVSLSSQAITVLVFLGIFLSSIPLFRWETVTPHWNPETWVWLLANAALDAINVVTFFGAMEQTTIAVAVLTHYFAPVIVALLAPWIDKKSVLGSVRAALIATMGLALVLQPWRTREMTFELWVGAAMGLTSAFAYAGNVFVIQRIAGRIGPARAMGYHSLISAVLILPFVDFASLSPVPMTDVLLIAVGAAIPGCWAGWMFVRGLRAIGSARAAILTYLEPLVAVLIGWLVWNESISAGALLGGVLILGAGLYVMLPRPLPHKRSNAEPKHAAPFG